MPLGYFLEAVVTVKWKENKKGGMGSATAVERQNQAIDPDFYSAQCYIWKRCFGTDDSREIPITLPHARNPCRYMDVSS